jgi:ERCC4-type nuclease
MNHLRGVFIALLFLTTSFFLIIIPWSSSSSIMKSTLHSILTKKQRQKRSKLQRAKARKSKGDLKKLLLILAKGLEKGLTRIDIPLGVLKRGLTQKNEELRRGEERCEQLRKEIEEKTQREIPNVSDT